MKSTIIAEEELAHKVLVGFGDDFAMSGQVSAQNEGLYVELRLNVIIMTS